MAINSRQQLINEVAQALDMRLDEGCFYLNLTEQEIGPNCPAEFVGEENSWPHDGNEVVRIEPLPSHEAFEAMEKFADRQSQSVSSRLYLALRDRHPFSRFKETLANVGLLDEWYGSKNDWYAQKAEEWLQEESVDFQDGEIVCSGNTLTWNEDEE